MPLRNPSFTLSKYRQVVTTFLTTGRTFCDFSDHPDQGLVLRLDVDFDPTWAAELALINKELGVNATFFIQVSSAMYNALDSHNTSAIRSISAFQNIGLHFAVDAEPWDRTRLEFEYRILRSIAPEAKRWVAWHNPGADLQYLNSEAEQAGFLTPYMSRWFGESKYISDSNARNHPDEITRFVAASREPLVQVLLHPFNWYHGGDDMPQILARAFRAKVAALAAAFDQNNVWRQGIGDTMMKRLGLSDLCGASPHEEKEA